MCKETKEPHELRTRALSNRTLFIRQLMGPTSAGGEVPLGLECEDAECHADRRADARRDLRTEHVS